MKFETNQEKMSRCSIPEDIIGKEINDIIIKLSQLQQKHLSLLYQQTNKEQQMKLPQQIVIKKWGG